MKKTIVSLISFITFTINVNAQEILDISHLECNYSFTFMKDTTERTKTVKDSNMILLIGNKYSKFYSYTTFFRDSIINSMSVAEQENMLLNNSAGLVNFTSKYPQGEKYTIYKNYLDSTITHTDKQLMEKMRYIETMPKQNWKILSEIKEIAGYKCQKATCSFRGRNYIAWFTRDIPINEGPWKFNGLPGLIVKVYDTQEHYDFELYSMRKINKPIEMNEKDYPKISREDYIRICRNFIRNPLGNTNGVLTSVNGTPIKPKVRQYDVMERDVK